MQLRYPSLHRCKFPHESRCSVHSATDHSQIGISFDPGMNADYHHSHQIKKANINRFRGLIAEYSKREQNICTSPHPPVVSREPENECWRGLRARTGTFAWRPKTDPKSSLDGGMDGRIDIRTDGRTDRYMDFSHNA